MEKKTTHTPGPWKLWQDAPGGFEYRHGIIVDAHGRQVGTGNKPEDARLIAAAPDLLAALKGIANIHPCWDKPCPNDDCPAAIVRAAIAKAEGWR